MGLTNTIHSSFKNQYFVIMFSVINFEFSIISDIQIDLNMSLRPRKFVLKEKLRMNVDVKLAKFNMAEEIN